MDPSILLLLVAVFLACLISGVYCTIKYIRTKKTVFLVAGLILTLVVIALLILFLLSEVPSPFMVYGPAPHPPLHVSVTPPPASASPTLTHPSIPASPTPSAPTMAYGPAPR